MNKNFEPFKEFYLTINFKFRIVFCFPKTSIDNISFIKNLHFQLSDYKVLHRTRQSCKRGKVCVFVHESLSFIAIQSLSIERSSTKSKGILLNNLKNVVLAGDFNIN